MHVTNLAEGVAGMTSNAWFVDGASPALVDAGAGFDVVDRIERTGSTPERLVVTHTHPDHVGNVEAVREAFGVEPVGHDPDSPFVDHPLEDGGTVALGDGRFEAWFTPGHAADHLCLYDGEAKLLFSGDLIFPGGGVGRTDLPGADHEQLLASIRRVLGDVDRDLAGLYAGHGPAVTAAAYRHVQAAARHVGLR